MLIKNVRLVRPGHHLTRVEPAIDAALVREVFDARGRYVARPDSAPGASSP